MSFEDGLIRGGVQAAEDSATQTQSDALKSMTALNYCTFSLSKIKEYNDRVVLDEEYNNIINSISLKNIPDQKIVGIIKQLMDTLTAFRLSEMEKEKLFKEYENSQQTAVMTMLMEMASPSISAAGNVAGNMVSTVISAVGYKGAAVGMFGASTLAMLGAPVAATVAATAGVVAIPVLFVAGHSVYSEHQRRHREQIKKHNEKLDDHTWTMSKYAIRAINELNKSFLETYWPILQDSDAPENWRVTSDQIDDLLKTAKESDPATRHRNLIRLEKKCEFIPAYWYYRADAAHSALQKEGEGNFAEDIALCLERYGSFAGFFRKDPLHGSLLMFHMATMQLSPEVVYKYLNDLVEPFPRDASKRLFAALTCIRYGFYDEAAEHLQANIDLKQFEVVSRTLLTGVYEKKKNTDGQIALLQKLMEDESTSNQEILFQLGEISVGEQFLRRIVPEVSAIALKVESNLLYRLDDLLLTLPARWLLAENDLALATLYIGNHKVTPTKLKMEKEGENVAITFERIVDRKRMLKGDVVPLKIEVPTTHFPLIVTGRLEPVTEKNKLGELAGEALETLKDSKVGELVSEALGPLLVDDKLLFTLERIQSGTSCFSWKDGKMRRCVQ